MIGNFRKTFGSMLIKAFLILIVLSFVLWGIGDIVKNLGNNYAAKVAGKTIPIELLEMHVEKEKRRIEMQSGEPFQDAMKGQLTYYVLDRLMNNEVIDKYLNKEHLLISDKAALESIKKEEIFKDKEGKFDPAKLREFVLSNKINERKFVDDIQKEISRKMLLEVITSRVPSNDIAKIIKQYLNLEYTITVYKLDTTKQSSSYIPTKEEKQKFYETNKSLFLSQETRDANYFKIPVADLRKSITISQEELENEYKLRDYRDAKFSLENIKSKLEADITAKKLEQKLQDISNNIDDDIASGMNIDEIAKKFNAKNMVINNLSISSENPAIPGILRDKIVSDNNMEEAKLVYNLNDAIYVYKISRITEPYPLAYEKVEDLITNSLKTEHYLKFMRDLAQKPENAKQLNLETHQYKFKVAEVQQKLPVTIPGNLINDSLNNDIGSFTNVYKGMENMFYMAKIDDINEIQDKIENEAQVDQAIKGHVQNEILWAFFTNLKDEYGAKINRNVLQPHKDSE